MYFYILISDFHYIGKGWCISDAGNNVNGYYKDESNVDECRTTCSQEPACTGYAISTQQDRDPNRCYVYGNISSPDPISKWNFQQGTHFVPAKSSNGNNRYCWQRKGIRIVSTTLIWLSIKVRKHGYNNCLIELI